MNSTLESVDTWRERFAVLHAEWERLDRDEVEGWRSSIAEMRAADLALVASGTWTEGPTDLLTIARVDRRELAHSAILAWLLRPTGSHGLGYRFLEHFLAHAAVRLEPRNLASVKVATEVARGSRRADVVVWGRDLLMVVEMKVHAGESPGQCGDLERLFGPAARYVFLTPDGRSPSSTDSSRWTSLSFRHVAAILAETLRAEPATPGAIAASHYLHSLRERFS